MGPELATYVENVAGPMHPGEPIYIVGHSNGGNIAVIAAQNTVRIKLVIRLGSPPNGNAAKVDQYCKVLDVYDPLDRIGYGASQAVGAAISRPPDCANWRSVKVNAPWSRWDLFFHGQPRGLQKHVNMHTVDVWQQVAAWIKANQQFMKPGNGSPFYRLSH